VTEDCYCREAPRDPATRQPRFRCNACWNGLVESKNELVRENQVLRAALRRAQTLAGHPDAAEGCRNVIAAAGQALGD
jgi:hypothetical protein